MGTNGASANRSVKKTVREWCEENLNKYPTKEELISYCMKALGVKRKQVLHILKYLKSPSTVITNQQSVGLSEDELRSKCDAMYKIEQAIKNLPENRFIPESEFREFFCNLNTIKFRSKADMPQFEKYKGKAGGIVYWARHEDIKRLKESGVLQ